MLRRMFARGEHDRPLMTLAHAVPPPLFSSFRGDMSTSISLQNTQKIVLTASDTVGKEVSTSFSIMPKFDVPLPEYNQEVRLPESGRF